jgi:hypothetical protein
MAFAARLKSCPDTKPSQIALEERYSAACFAADKAAFLPMAELTAESFFAASPQNCKPTAAEFLLSSASIRARIT